MIKYCPGKWHNWAKRPKRRRYWFRKTMFMRMTFHLMEIMILKEAGRSSIELNVSYLPLIDSHVLVSFAIVLVSFAIK